MLVEKVEHRPVADLIPYARNSRTHSDEQVEQIAASIQKFGFNNPVLIASDGTIVAGHGRLLAAKVIGLTHVPVVELAHLSDAERRAYVIADNRLAELSGWDKELLSLELRDLDALDFDLDVIGFSDKELDRLLIEPEDMDGEDEDGEEEAAAPLPSEPVTVSGDVWILGDHRLFCGDSTKPESYAAVLNGEPAHLLLTDPPYGMSYGGGRKKGNDKKKAWDLIQNDDLQGSDLAKFLKDTVGLALKNTYDDASVYVFLTWRTVDVFGAVLRDIGLEHNALIVWDKKSIGIGGKHYRPQHEFCYYCDRGRWFGGRNQSDVWRMSRGATGEYVHPTQKPVALLEKPVRNSSKPGEIVLDIFGGSGSTLIACEKRGRAARLIEMEPKYCDAIIGRWQALTGRAAVLESTGKTHAEITQERAKKKAS